MINQSERFDANQALDFINKNKIMPLIERL